MMDRDTNARGKPKSAVQLVNEKARDTSSGVTPAQFASEKRTKAGAGQRLVVRPQACFDMKRERASVVLPAGGLWKQLWEYRRQQRP